MTTAVHSLDDIHRAMLADKLQQWILDSQGEPPIQIPVPRDAAVAIAGLLQIAVQVNDFGEGMTAIIHDFVDAIAGQMPPEIAEIVDAGWGSVEIEQDLVMTEGQHS